MAREEAKEDVAGTAVGMVIGSLFDLGHATSIDIAENTGLPVSQVSSALSRIYKRIPQVIARDEGKRPYRWRVLMETSPEEAYRMYMTPPPTYETDSSAIQDLAEPGASIPDPGVSIPGIGGLAAGVATEFKVVVSGRVEVVVGWLERP